MRYLFMNIIIANFLTFLTLFMIKDYCQIPFVISKWICILSTGQDYRLMLSLPMYHPTNHPQSYDCNPLIFSLQQWILFNHGAHSDYLIHVTTAKLCHFFFISDFVNLKNRFLNQKDIKKARCMGHVCLFHWYEDNRNEGLSAHCKRGDDCAHSPSPFFKMYDNLF